MLIDEAETSASTATDKVLVGAVLNEWQSVDSFKLPSLGSIASAVPGSSSRGDMQSADSILSRLRRLDSIERTNLDSFPIFSSADYPWSKVYDTKDLGDDMSWQPTPLPAKRSSSESRSTFTSIHSIPFSVFDPASLGTLGSILSNPKVPPVPEVIHAPPIQNEGEPRPTNATKLMDICLRRLVQGSGVEAVEEALHRIKQEVNYNGADQTVTELPQSESPTTIIPPQPAPAPMPMRPTPREEGKGRNAAPDAKVLVEYTELDVLCQRGTKSRLHPGCQQYRKLIEKQKPVYKTITAKFKKTQFVMDLVKVVHSYGGRFLQKDKETGSWYIISDDAARTKVGQALREKNTPQDRQEKRNKYNQNQTTG